MWPVFSLIVWTSSEPTSSASGSADSTVTMLSFSAMTLRYEQVTARSDSTRSPSGIALPTSALSRTSDCTT